MSYIEKHLMDDEELVHITRLHAIILLAPAMVVSVLAGCISIVSDIPVAFYLVAFLLLLAVWRLADRLLLYLTSEFGVTSKRVLGKTGLIRLKSTDIVLAKVEAIRLNQSILGRICNFGDVLVTGTGGTEEVLSYIPDPIVFSKCIQQQLTETEEVRQEPGTPLGVVR
ncbi:MAG: PH domain-containing protein [Pseudomonadota bacterium]|jgi:uncharacterized membrane protein YdbT with pleckstrin-like domain